MNPRIPLNIQKDNQQGWHSLFKAYFRSIFRLSQPQMRTQELEHMYPTHMFTKRFH